MRNALSLLTCAAALTTAGMLGCDRTEPAPTPPPAQPAPQVTTPTADETRNAASDAMDATKRAAENAADKTQEVAGQAVDATKDAAAATADKARELTADAKDAASDAKADTTAAANNVTAEATTLMDQTVQYVKENKWELADTSMAKLESMKDRLPESLKPRYQQVKTMYDSAKASKGVKLPGM